LQDLVPVPEHGKWRRCQEILDSVDEDEENEELMDITWKLSFSGRSPLKALIGDMIAGSASTMKPHKVNETEEDSDAAQDVIEVVRKYLLSVLLECANDTWNCMVSSDGLLGHQSSERSHPRRRVVLYTLL
jgi:hypothetical protein